MRPTHNITTVPSVMPIFDMACGMASTPAPTMVFTRLMTEEAHDALPPSPLCLLCLERRDCEDIDAGCELPCSLGILVIAAYCAMGGGFWGCSFAVPRRTRGGSRQYQHWLRYLGRRLARGLDPRLQDSQDMSSREREVCECGCECQVV